MYMQKFVDGGPAQQVTQFQPTFSPAQQGIGSIQQAPNTPAMESSPTDYNQSPQYAPTQQYGAPATSYSAPAPMTAGLGSYMEGLKYKAPVAPTPPPINTGATGATGAYANFDPATLQSHIQSLLAQQAANGGVNADPVFARELAKAGYVAPASPTGGTTSYDPTTQTYGNAAASVPSAPAQYPDMPMGLTYGGEQTYYDDEGALRTAPPRFKDASGTNVFYDPAVAFSAGYGTSEGDVPDTQARAARYYYDDGGDNETGPLTRTYVPNKTGGRIHSYAQGGSIPQGIASLGRGQDSMLVHMTPGEVQGLQKLAMAHGGSLTINPQTGLPEAGFLSALLPTIAGIGLNMAFPGAGALLIGAGVGGVAALTSGSLKKGLMAGLGAYGGAGLGSSLSSMGAEQAKGLAAADTISSGNASVDSVGAFAKANQQAAIEEAVKTANAENAAGNFGEAPYMGDDAYRAQLADNPAGRLSYNARPADFAANPFSRQGVGYAQSLGDPVANIQQQAREAAFNAPAYNEATQAALARGPAGNALQGIRQLGEKGGISALGKNLGFAGAAGLAAPFLSSAMEPGKFNPPANRPAQFFNTSYNPPRYNPQTGTYEPASYGPGSYSTAYAAKGGAVGYDEGGIARFYPLTGDDRGPGEKPQYSSDISGPDSGAGINNNKAGRGVYSDATGKGVYENTPSGVENLFAKTSALTLTKHLKSKSTVKQAAALAELRKRANAVDDYADDTISAAQGGLMGLNTYAAGGKLLRGPGDGMSDSIPAVIGGAKPQRAALADGEFVIPADVVSHLGNGSTEAGSKRLYSMMDKVRKARTGNPKQGKQINPDRFMPA